MKALIRARMGLLVVGLGCFTMTGAGQAFMGPSLAAWTRMFDLAPGEAALAISAMWLGGGLAVWLCFRMGPRLGLRHSLGLTLLGAACIGTSLSWPVVLAGVLVFGIGTAMTSTMLNPTFLRRFAPHGSAMLGLLNMSFGVGAIVAPLVFLLLAGDAGASYWLVALLVGGLWLAAVPRVMGEDADLESPEAAARSWPQEWARMRRHVWVVLFVTIGVGFEAALVGLGPTALVQAGVDEREAAGALSLFFILFVLARASLVVLGQRVRAFVIYIAATWAALIFMLGAALIAPLPFFILMGVPVGFFFPTFFVASSKVLGEHPRVSPIIMAAGLSGGIVAPLIVAPLLQSFGERSFFWVLAIGALGAVALAMLAARLMLGGHRAPPVLPADGAGA